jgi:hypothetical protein
VCDLGFRYDAAMTSLLLHSQEDRELAQALRVQGMSDVERANWLIHEWGGVQHRAGLFRAQSPPHQPGARCFATPQEKNAFDEAREIAFAVEHSVFATSQKATQHEAARTRS